MTDSNDERNDRAKSDLIIVLGVLLSLSLPDLVSIPKHEAILVGWMIAFLAGYFIPPRRPFVRWMLERLIFITCFYLIALKTPMVLKHSLPTLFAYGIPYTLFVIGFIAWLRYAKNSLRPTRA